MDTGDTGEGRRASAEERRMLERLSVPAGLCASCEHLRVLASKRSVFVRCGLAEVDAAFPRYPPLPVVACRGYAPAAPHPPDPPLPPSPTLPGEGGRKT